MTTRELNGRTVVETTAGALKVGDYVVEQRRASHGSSENVALRVERVAHGRFSVFELADGSVRNLSPYVEVWVLPVVTETEAELAQRAVRLFRANPAASSVTFVDGTTIARDELVVAGLLRG